MMSAAAASAVLAARPYCSHAIGRARSAGASIGSCVGTGPRRTGSRGRRLAAKQKSRGPNARTLLLAQTSAFAAAARECCHQTGSRTFSRRPRRLIGRRTACWAVIAAMSCLSTCAPRRAAVKRSRRRRSGLPERPAVARSRRSRLELDPKFSATRQGRRAWHREEPRVLQRQREQAAKPIARSRAERLLETLDRLEANRRVEIQAWSEFASEGVRPTARVCVG